MYLVDLGFGQERLFQSGNELAEAIRGGIVGAQSRIYHRTRATWLPITIHPEYRRITGEYPVVPRMTSTRREWTFMRAEGLVEIVDPVPHHPPQEIMVLPRATSSRWRNLGSVFRFWGRGTG
jgi:hypothetical protein